MAGEDL